MGTKHRRVLVVDAANVVGATPNGWWNDRPGAAARLHHALLVGDTGYEEVVLVVEGQAKQGVRPGKDAHVRTVHAARDGDSAIVKAAQAAAEAGREVAVVTADRALAGRVEFVGARVHTPTWLLSCIDY
ncbi:MAG: hypothetical protein V9F00_08645 [Nocardioides sp.]